MTRRPAFVEGIPTTLAELSDTLPVRVAHFVFILAVMVVATLVAGPAVIVLSVLGTTEAAFATTRLWCRLLLDTTGVTLRTHGLENFPDDPALVVISNHTSHYDGPALLLALPFDLHFVIKQELARIPLWGQAVVALGFIPIDRGDSEAARRRMARAVETVRRGRTVLVFAEGTRSPRGSLQRFKKGGFHLAVDARVPIVPVTINGSHAILPRGSWLPRPGTLEIHVGEPIPTAGLGKEDVDRLLEATRTGIAASFGGPVD